MTAVPHVCKHINAAFTCAEHATDVGSLACFCDILINAYLAMHTYFASMRQKILHVLLFAFAGRWPQARRPYSKWVA